MYYYELLSDLSFQLRSVAWATFYIDIMNTMPRAV